MHLLFILVLYITFSWISPSSPWRLQDLVACQKNISLHTQVFFVNSFWGLKNEAKAWAVSFNSAVVLKASSWGSLVGGMNGSLENKHVLIKQECEVDNCLLLPEIVIKTSS